MVLKFCCRCQKHEIERIDDWESNQCSRCNDVDIERSRERQEWDHYHPAEDSDREPKKSDREQ